MNTQPQTTLSIGPIHPWLPGMMRLELFLQGDIIQSALPAFGYASKNIFEKVYHRSLHEAQRFFSRIEPEGAYLVDRLFSEAVERAAGIEVPARAQWIRSITFELSEALAALKFLAQMASHLGLPILNHLLLKHREELLDLSERLAGSRFGYYYLVPGGARLDLTDGFLERLETWCRNLKNDFPRIRGLLCWSRPIQYRLEDLGVVLDQGQEGFISESRVEGRMGWQSSVGSRIDYVLSELQSLAKSMEEDAALNVSGPHLTKLPDQIRSKPTRVNLDTFRGSWEAEFSWNAKGLIDAIRLKTPSDAICGRVPEMLEGEALDDVGLILHSSFLSVTEIDR